MQGVLLKGIAFAQSQSRHLSRSICFKVSMRMSDVILPLTLQVSKAGMFLPKMLHVGPYMGSIYLGIMSYLWGSHLLGSPMVSTKSSKPMISFYFTSTAYKIMSYLWGSHLLGSPMVSTQSCKPMISFYFTSIASKILTQQTDWPGPLVDLNMVKWPSWYEAWINAHLLCSTTTIFAPSPTFLCKKK